MLGLGKRQTTLLFGVLLCVTLTAEMRSAVADSMGGTGGSGGVKPYPTGINCVWLKRIQGGWTDVIDERHLTIRAIDHSTYLLTLFDRCYDLDDSADTNFQTDGTNLCGPGSAVITRMRRCPIQYLEEVSNPAEARTIVKARNIAETAARKSRSNGGG